jgi:hypothetical protein
MRLPIGLAAIALLGLLGGSVVAATAIAPQASNAAEPPTETYAAMNMSVGSEHFTSEVNACVSGAPAHLPEGTDAHLFCDCAVEKIFNDATPPEAIAQCAAELQVTGPFPRTREIGECVSGSPGHLPAGTDANAFCTCAVDKMMFNNATQNDAIGQCATAMHITLPARE